LGLLGYNLDFFPTFIVALLGNMVPVFFILYYFQHIIDWLTTKSDIATRFSVWLFQRTRRKFFKQHQLYGALALALFVAVPLPVTGAWTASMAAVIFGIEKKYALIYIALGLIGAGIIVALFTEGISLVI
jgi:uncharacterized membrane protein